ncbi:MAG: BACON domain-containing protein [Lachnospiraceae bacterium]|nr:BACON domain-containing protein [Lachnospiraceae bacterium]
MRKLHKFLATLSIILFSVIMLSPIKAHAENRVISGPVEAYSSRSQNCTFRLSTENNWRAECQYSWIHLSNTTGSYGDSDLRFTIDENTSTNSRMGWIVVYDQRMYYPIFTFEINQAGANSAPPAVGPYFSNEVAALDDGYETVAWNTQSYNFKFMSNRNVTMKVDGKSVTLSKTSINNGYLYQYTLNMGNNYTLSSRSFRVEVKVDGTNVSGGNSHTYTIAQNRTPIILKDAKILDGRISSEDGGYGNKPLKISVKANDSIQVWYTWRSRHSLGSYSTKSSDKTILNYSYTSSEMVNGSTISFTLNPTFTSTGLARTRKDLKVHIKSVHSSTEIIVDVDFNKDYNPSSSGSGGSGGSGGGGQSEPEKPKDEKIEYEIQTVTINAQPYMKAFDQLQSSYSVVSDTASIFITFESFNVDWVILETYAPLQNIYSFNVVATSSGKENTYYLNTIFRQPGEISGSNGSIRRYTRDYYIMTKDEYLANQFDIDRYFGSDIDFFLGGFKNGTWKKLFSVTCYEH